MNESLCFSTFWSAWAMDGIIHDSEICRPAGHESGCRNLSCFVHFLGWGIPQDSDKNSLNFPSYFGMEYARPWNMGKKLLEEFKMSETDIFSTDSCWGMIHHDPRPQDRSDTPMLI